MSFILCRTSIPTPSATPGAAMLEPLLPFTCIFVLFLCESERTVSADRAKNGTDVADVTDGVGQNSVNLTELENSQMGSSDRMAELKDDAQPQTRSSVRNEYKETQEKNKAIYSIPFKITRNVVVTVALASTISSLLVTIVPLAIVTILIWRPISRKPRMNNSSDEQQSPKSSYYSLKLTEEKFPTEDSQQ
ncbi:unnamed protein product [Toxocara canis]|uniref:Cytotoxic and regulatory T-cell molecule n=1 Tax=Toxocara canis TaxID=6265 RepID=A0A183TZ32_TOXCA|nr:unnamed protein product [Toxocara canis]